MRILLITLIFFTMTMSSCNIFLKPNFWRHFDKLLIAEDISNQGPWGGQSSLHFESLQKGRFNTARILSFAFEYGWTFIDSVNYKGEEIKSWLNGNELIFPVYVKGFDSKDSILYNNFPRWIHSDLTMYRFKTRLLVFNPGTDDSTDENGYILLSKTRDSMTVYHIWGE